MSVPTKHSRVQKLTPHRAAAAVFLGSCIVTPLYEAVNMKTHKLEFSRTATEKKSGRTASNSLLTLRSVSLRVQGFFGGSPRAYRS